MTQTQIHIKGYDILHSLGEGGMGTVYLARQLSLNRLVAIKVLSEALTENSSYIMRFQQEAQAAAKLKHNNLVQVYDAGVSNNLFYFIMEYLDGETVAQRVHRKGRIEETPTLLIAESVALALDYAWNNARLVHRDIKPENLLIDKDGTVKVSDLGLAKLIGSNASHITLTKMVIGTPYYCAPEQALGKSEIDYRADIYALGATMYHLATGYAPFSGTTNIQGAAGETTHCLTDPREHNFSLSENFARLLQSMMARRPEMRPAAWSSVLADIDRVLNNTAPLVPLLAADDSVISLKKAEHSKLSEAKLKQQLPKNMLAFFLLLALIGLVSFGVVWVILKLI